MVQLQHVTTVFCRKNKHKTNATIESDPVDVPNANPLESTCALKTPTNAARVTTTFSTSDTKDNASQAAHAIPFFLDLPNIERRRKVDKSVAPQEMGTIHST